MVLLPFRTVLPQTENGLVYYFSASKGGGVETQDYSTRGCLGTIYGAAWKDNKLSFDGNDYVRVNVGKVSPHGYWSVIVSIYCDPLPTELVPIISHPSGYEDSIVSLAIKNDEIFFAAINTWDYRSKHNWVSATLQPGHIHIAFTYNRGAGDKFNVYLNGKKIAENITGETITSYTKKDFYLGYGKVSDHGYIHTRYFQGEILEIKIYAGRLLSDDEIYAHFKGAVIKLRP